jgi:hypothetical protein
MALTRPRIDQFNSTSTVLKDPITVLHGGSTAANVDVGFLLNRANGLVSNVALYWNETGNTFVTAFTSNTGNTDSNITATSFANITTGFIIPGANVTYDIGTPTQRFRSLYLSGNTIDLAGAVFKTDPATGAVVVLPNPTAAQPNPTGIVISPAGTISTIVTQAGNVSLANIAAASNAAVNSSMTTFANVTATGNLIVGGNLTVAGTVTFQNTVVETSTETVLGVEIVGGNLVANSGTASTSTTTGALVVQGGAGISGNVFVGNITAQNVFIDRGVDVNDWDALTTMGVYLINRSSWTGTTNTPTNSQYFTGQLEVVNTANVSIAQYYRPYNSTASGDIYWTRSKYSSGAWSNWVEVINGSEVMDGGSF